MKQPKISVVIVTWNGASYIEACLDSVLNQSVPSIFVTDDGMGEFFPFFDILVVDNGSDDKTIDIIATKYKSKINLVRNKSNLGFSRGYNKAIHWTSGRYILLLNQDVILDKDYLMEAVSFLDTYSEVAVVTGKVLKWDYLNQKKTDIIDSTGLEFHKNFSFSNSLEGVKDKGQADEIKPVFGFSGSVALVRRGALYDIKEDMQFFDEAFWSYKEDVDVSFRLRWRNWDIVYLPVAKAYHKRSVGASTDNKSFSSIASHHNRKADLINYLSYRNHIMLLIKNIPLSVFFKYFFNFVVYEMGKFFYILFTKPQIHRVWLEIFKEFPSLLKKRKQISKNRKINPLGIKPWIQ